MQKAGGDVHVMNGNYEIMNMEGDFCFATFFTRDCATTPGLDVDGGGALDGGQRSFGRESRDFGQETRRLRWLIN